MADAYSALVLASTPLVYYRFNDPTTAIADSSGNSHGMTAGAGVTLQATGLLGVSADTAVRLPSNNTRTAANSITSSGRVPALEVTSALTIEFWFKPNVLGAGTQQDLICYGTDAVAASAYVVYSYGTTSANKQIGFQVLIGGTGVFFQSGPSLVAGTTYHVVCSYDGTTLRTYVNGTQQGTHSASGTIGPYGAMGLCIGNDPSFSDDNAQSVIDEVAIYGSVLSPATILNHYNTGITPGSTWSMAPSDTTSTPSDIPGITKGTSASDSYSAIVLASSPSAYYRLDDATTSIADSSGNGYWLTAGSSVSLRTQGLLDQTVSTDMAATLPIGGNSLDSVFGNSRISALEPAAAITVEAWVMPTTAVAGAYQDLVAYGPVAAFADYDLGHFGSTAANHTFYFSPTIGGAGHTVTGSTIIVPGTTYHVVGVYDGANLRIYVNGVLDSAPVPITGSLNGYAAGHFLVLGNGSDYGNAGLSGVLDEVAIYPVALSAATIASHYQSGTAAAFSSQIRADGATAYYPMSETSGTTATDQIAPAANGTYGSAITLNNLTLTPGSPARKAPLFAAANANSILSIPWTSKFVKTTQSFSWCVALHKPATPVASSRIIHFVDGVLGTWLQLIRWDPATANQLLCEIIFTSGGTVFVALPFPITAGTFLVHFTFNNATGVLTGYINGASPVTVTHAGDTFIALGAGGGVGIGNKFGTPDATGDGFGGNIGDVAYFSGVALTAAQVLTQYQAWLTSATSQVDTISAADTEAPISEAPSLTKGSVAHGISAVDTNVVSESASATDVIFDPTAGPEHAATVTEAPTLAKAGTPKTISAAEAAAAVTESAAVTDVIFDPTAGPEHAATVTETPVTPDTRPAPLTDTGAAVSEAPTAKVVRRVAAADTEPVSADAPTVTDPQKHVTQAEVGATVSEAPAPKDVHKIAATEAAAAVTETPTVTRVTKTVSAADTDPTISEAPGFRQVHVQPAADTIAPTTEAPAVSDVHRIAATDVDPAFSEIISARDATRLVTDTAAAISEAAALRDTHKIAQAESAAAVTEAATLGPVKARAATDTDPATSEAATARDVRQPTIAETLAPETEAPKLADVRRIAAAEAAAAVTEAPTAFAAAIPHSISEPETGATVTEAPDLGKTAISGHSVTETEAPTTEAPTLADTPSTLPPPQPPAPVVITPASWSGFRRVTDFSLNFGGDLTPASNGDFGVAQDAVLSKQRVIRRLINNSRQVVDGRVLPADYIYHQDYGASLGRKVGSDVGPSDASTILAYIRTTMRGEDSVDLTQPVNVDTTIVSGGVRLQISYTSAGKVITLPAVVVS